MQIAIEQRKNPETVEISGFSGCGDRTWTCDLRVMRNLKFVCYSVVLLCLVVLCTKAQNGFCPMCTKVCYTVPTRSKPFWGQFWGQVGETDSRQHRSNKCAALGSLENTHTHITGFSQWKSQKNQYISFTLQQEVVCKPNPQRPRTLPLSPRETPLFGRVRSASARYSSGHIPPQNPRFPGIFYFTAKAFTWTGFPCTGKSNTNK